MPLLSRLHDGLRETAEWEESEEIGASHVVRLVSEACRCAALFGSAFLLPDRLYPSVEALLILNAHNVAHSCRVGMVSRMKRNAIAWTEAPQRRPGQPGRSRKKGDKVKLWELFETKEAEFQFVIYRRYTLLDVSRRFLCSLTIINVLTISDFAPRSASRTPSRKNIFLLAKNSSVLTPGFLHMVEGESSDR